MPVCGGGLFTKEYVKEHNDEFDFVYNNLADEKSKSDYVDIINFKVSGKVDYLLKSYCDKDSVYKDIMTGTQSGNSHHLQMENTTEF